MAFDNSSPSIETRFQLNTTPNEIIRIEDNTDYVGTYGIALADVIGALKITSPIGTVFHNTVLPAFDIDMDVQTYIDTIALPTDSDGAVLKGTYTVEYTVRVAGAVDPGDYTKTFLYNYCDPEVDVQVGVTVDLINAQVTSTDLTAYPLELTNSTRTHSVHPPAGANPVDFPVQTLSTTVNVYGPDITTKTWTGKVINILELTYPASGAFSEHIIDVTVNGNTEKDIVDDVNICNLQCNMRALTARYADALANNPINAVKIANDQLTPALVNSFMYTSNIACGNFDKAEFYYQEVLKFTGSQPDCECSDSDVPTLIQASGSGGGNNNTYIVDVCGTNSALSVTANVIGDETTYTICFDDTIWTKINALTETDIISSDASVSISDNTVGYTKTYDLSVTPSTPVDSFSGMLDIVFDANPVNLPVSNDWRAGWSTVVGSKLQTPTVTEANGVNWGSSNALWYLEGYIAASGGEFPKPEFQVVGQAIRGSFNGKFIEARLVWIDTATDRIYFDFYDANGLAFSGPALANIVGTDKGPLSVSVIINA